MNCLVTLAPDGGLEPYASGVRGLAEAARLAEWAFLQLGDAALGGDRPWQAKRIVIRQAFEAGAERVVWSDADVLVRRPGELATILGQEGRPGLWSCRPLDVPSYFRMQAIRNRGDADLMSEVCALYRGVCREYGLTDDGPHFMDWFVTWVVPRDTAMRILDIWDCIAGRLLREGLTWSDGLSLGIAAVVCGVPVRYCLRWRRMRRAVVHLSHSNRTGRYAAMGRCSP